MTTKMAYEVVTDGEKTRFGEREVELGVVEGVAPGGIFHAAALGDGAVGLVTFASGFTCGFHNTEAPTWMFIMKGQMEVEVSDGATRLLGPGDLVHFGDADGQGHKSRVLGDEDVIAATAGYQP